VEESEGLMGCVGDVGFGGGRDGEGQKGGGMEFRLLGWKCDVRWRWK
jgi:hypothetical protein